MTTNVITNDGGRLNWNCVPAGLIEPVNEEAEMDADEADGDEEDHDGNGDNASDNEPRLADSPDSAACNSLEWDSNADDFAKS